MKNPLLKAIVIVLLTFFVLSCTKNKPTETQEKNYAQTHYTKTETTITMRDGIQLFKTIYSPKDQSTAYPILLMRTPYSCRPYGTDKYRKKIGTKYPDNKVLNN